MSQRQSPKITIKIIKIMKNLISFFILFFFVTVCFSQKKVFKSESEIIKYFLSLKSVQEFLQVDECSNQTGNLILADTQKIIRQCDIKLVKWGNCNVTVLDSDELRDSLRQLSYNQSLWDRFRYFYFLRLKYNYVVIYIPYKSRSCIFKYRRVKKGYIIAKREFITNM
jgi:hypothetical protein